MTHIRTNVLINFQDAVWEIVAVVKQGAPPAKGQECHPEQWTAYRNGQIVGEETRAYDSLGPLEAMTWVRALAERQVPETPAQQAARVALDETIQSYNAPKPPVNETPVARTRLEDFFRQHAEKLSEGRLMDSEQQIFALFCRCVESNPDVAAVVNPVLINMRQARQLCREHALSHAQVEATLKRAEEVGFLEYVPAWSEYRINVRTLRNVVAGVQAPEPPGLPAGFSDFLRPTCAVLQRSESPDAAASVAAAMLRLRAVTADTDPAVPPARLLLVQACLIEAVVNLRRMYGGPLPKSEQLALAEENPAMLRIEAALVAGSYLELLNCEPVAEPM